MTYTDYQLYSQAVANGERNIRFVSVKTSSDYATQEEWIKPSSALSAAELQSGDY